MPPISSVTQKQLSSVRDLVAASWQAVAEDRLRFIAFISFFVVSFSLELASPWAIAEVIDLYVEHGVSEATFQMALWGVLIYVALKFSSLLIHHVARYLQIRVAFISKLHIFNKVFGAYMRYPLSWHVRHHSGDSLSKLHRAAGAIEMCVGTYVWQILEGMMKLVFAGIALFALDTWVAINVLAMSVITVLIVVLFNRKLIELIRKNNEFVDYLNRICVDYFFNVVTIKTLGLQEKAKEHLASQRNDGLARVRSIAALGEVKWGVIGVGYSLLIGSSLLIYFRDISAHSAVFEAGKVYVLLNYLDRVFQAVGSFTGYYSGVLEAATAYEDASTIIRGSEAAEFHRTVTPLVRPWREVALTEVSYAYASTERRGLDGIQVSFYAGEKIALVGPSGGGKSTLLKILGGILSPASGTALVDGVQVPFERVQASTLLIPQEPEIFAGSFLFNMTMGEHFSEKQLDDALSMCRVQDVLNKLPAGYDTDLAEKGLNISVGEKQRIALARGILRAAQKDFLLLDEPTSSLDPTTEKEVFDRVLRAFADRTIITACHRLSIAPSFDRIIFVRGGRIIEQGSFDELLRKNGEFATSWRDFQRDTEQVNHLPIPREFA
jgi:ATP-binding cassette subfamily B protein